MSTKDSANLAKSVYWNSYEAKPAKVIEKNIYKLLNASFQGVKKFFVLAYFIADDGNEEADIKDNKKYFLPRGEIKDNNLLINGRNFDDQPIDDIIKLYDEITKISAGYGDDCITGWLLDYAYFKDNSRLITFDLSNQKALDADPRAIQQIVFQGVVGSENNTKIRLCTILEKSKETLLEFTKGIAKVL